MRRREGCKRKFSYFLPLAFFPPFSPLLEESLLLVLVILSASVPKWIAPLGESRNKSILQEFFLFQHSSSLLSSSYNLSWNLNGDLLQKNAFLLQDPFQHSTFELGDEFGMSLKQLFNYFPAVSVTFFKTTNVSDPSKIRYWISN